jgi:diguanylate cyclase (GGDEF)-like protein/PAS domain S-box-containing protein
LASPEDYSARHTNLTDLNTRFPDPPHASLVSDQSAAADARLLTIRRTVAGVALAAASLLVSVALGLDFQWELADWLIVHGVFECLVLIVAGHIVSASYGLWLTSREPKWLLLACGFALTTVLNFGHVLLYASIVVPNPDPFSALFVWVHEAMACFAMLAAAWVVTEQKISGRGTAWLAAAMVLVFAALLVFNEQASRLIESSWMQRGNNFLNILFCLIAVLHIGSRAISGDRTPGIVIVGAAIAVEGIAQSSFVFTRQVSDAYTTLGHAYKLIAFALLYYGLFFTNFLRPYEIIRKTEALFRTLVERSPAGITLTRKGKIVHANRAFLQMFGFPDLEAARQVRLWELDSDESMDAATRWPSDKEETGSFMRRALRYDGSVIHVKVECEIVDMPGGRATLGYFVDLSDAVNAQNELQRLVNYDPLTSLPNRTLLRDRLEQAIRIGQRTGDLVAVLFIDLDQFKEVNDTLGHATGDDLLKLVADRLKDVCRREDTFGRLGGDEFLVIAHRLPTPEAASVLANKLITALEQPFDLQGRELYVGGSIGISLFPRDASDAGTMIKNADVAMYQAKRGGGPRVCFYSEEMNADAMERLEIGAELRRALEREEFEVHYQPKIDLADGRVVGVEGLLRWRSPTRGMVPPANFVSILEETGLIAPVGRFILAKACHDAMEWRAAGLGRVAVTVNLSPAQFRGSRLADDIEFALQASGLPYEDLEVEITESLLFEDLEQARTTLERLTNKGVRCTLDDFGTGYSSLSSLHYLPVHGVKVDRTFTQALQPGSSTIVAAIINVAHTLGMRVTAEGVETEIQREILRELGCDHIQGYIVAPPMSHDDLTVWLKSHRVPHLVSVGTSPSTVSPERSGS